MSRYIIDSLLDTDLYKITMQQAILMGNLHNLRAKHRFQCRTKNVNLSEIVEEIHDEVDHLCSLRFSYEEIDYLRSLDYIEEPYLDYIGKGRFQLSKEDIKIEKDDSREGGISINIEGNWFHTILFETPVLAIVSELYTRCNFPDLIADETSSGFARLEKKIELMNDLPKTFERDGKTIQAIPFSFVDFGTRRRFSKAWQELVLKTFKEHVSEQNFAGTSNVMFAKKLGLKPIGTQAHEWIEAGQGLDELSLDQSQRHMLELWENVYRGKLAIALTDTITTEKFLEDFDLYLAKLYDGVRQDSGEPEEIGDMIIDHYESLGIDPTSKTLICSNGLDWPRAIELWKYFNGRINIAFGIGTKTLNDFEEETSIQIVIKMVGCNGKPVAKISDSRGKTIAGKDVYLDKLMKAYDVED